MLNTRFLLFAVEIKQQPCLKEVDFAVVIGTSDTMGNQLPLAKKFASKLFSKFNAKSRAGVVDLNQQSKGDNFFAKTVDEFDRKLRDLPETSVRLDASRTILALNKAVSQMLASPAGSASARLIVLVIDDVDLSQVQREAMRLKLGLNSNGIRLLVVAVGVEDVSKLSVLTLYEHDIIKIDNFPRLLEKQTEVSAALAVCQIVGK